MSSNCLRRIIRSDAAEIRSLFPTYFRSMASKISWHGGTWAAFSDSVFPHRCQLTSKCWTQHGTERLETRFASTKGRDPPDTQEPNRCNSASAKWLLQGKPLGEKRAKATLQNDILETVLRGWNLTKCDKTSH